MQIAEQILQAMRKMGDKRTPIGETATHSKHVSSGEPDDAKVSSPVRRGVCGKVPEKVTRHFPTLLHHTGNSNSHPSPLEHRTVLIEAS